MRHLREFHTLYPTQKLIELARRLSRPSLATRTATATSILFLLAILVVGIASLHSFRTQLTNVLIAEQNTLVDRIADNVDQKLLALQRTLALSASEITERDISSFDAAQRYLDTNTGLYASIDRSVFLFDSEGILLAERPARANRRGDDASWRTYIRDTLRTRRPVISAPFISNTGDGNMVIVLTTPVFAKDGRFIAILTGSLGLTNPGMLGNVAKTVIGKTGYLYIVTADGKLIMHPDRARLSTLAFAPLANPLFDRALAGFEGTEESTDMSGRDALVSFKRVPSSNWLVAGVYPKDEAFLVVRDLIVRFIAVLLVACVIVLGAIWILTRVLMRPLVSLTQHLTDYAPSEQRIRPLSGGKGSGEIHALRTAFNRMTARLNEREDTLIETMQSYQLITENSTDLITRHSSSGIIIYASRVSASALGVPHTAMIGRSLLEFVHPDEYRLVHTAFLEATQTKTLRTVVHRARHVGQHYVWFETKMQLMKGATGEETSEILCISRNVNDRRQLEERLHELARTDHLTTLPNRVLLEERVAAGLAQSRREGSLLAMLMIDIDRFKNINDTLGHGIGDALLKLVAGRLKTCIRECDTLARWGGDEFVLVLPGLQSCETSETVAQRCLAGLKEVFVVDGQPLHVTASIGISVSAGAGADAADLCQDRAHRRSRGIDTLGPP